MYLASKMAETRRRVKLYVLNDERQWDDRGTGHVSSCLVERLNGMCLMVCSETDGSILLESKIQPDTAYQKQQETLIVWSENDNYDLALSFQERAGCDDIWEIICQVQGKDPSVDITQDVVDESEEDRFEELPEAATPIELPPCELSKLEEIAELFSSALQMPIKREKLATAIEKENYIRKLIELFCICEDLENTESLHFLYEIMKNTILLNKTSLLEIMFSDELIYDVVGCLEYDPSSTDPHRHRDYLNSKASFHEVIPITNRNLLNKIHQTYRVQYIQDVILPTPSVFEENMLSTLGSFIFFNKVDIVDMIQDDERFLPELFKQLISENTENQRRRDLVLFLKEFCCFAQNCQNREGFFKTLSSLGILSALEVVLGMDDADVRQAAIDIFSLVVGFNASMVREFIMNEGSSSEDDVLLINLVIEQMICDTDPDLGSALQLMNILRMLLDPENMMATGVQKTEKTEFLTFFYKHCMHVLTAPLLANTTEEKPSKDDYQTSQLLSLILELLTFAVEHHTYHIKNYIINKDLLRRILVVLSSSHQFLVLCAVRFLRKVVAMKDDFYNRYIVKGSLFKPVVALFKSNGNKYNLLNSALIELFEYIRIEDIKMLMTHIVETHGEDFKDVEYVSTFKGLKLKYDQHMDRLNTKPNLDNLRHASILQNSRYRRDARDLDEEEELWFDQDEDGEDSEAVVPVVDSAFRSAKICEDVMDDVEDTGRIIGCKKENQLLNRPDLLSSSNGRADTPLRPATGNSPKRTTTLPNRPSSPVTIPTNATTPPLKKMNSDSEGLGKVGSMGAKKLAGTTSPEIKANNVTTKQGGLVGLVDYPDEDSDEEEEVEDQPPMKRARIL